ncbi:hypothetical protein OUZ56_001611 [Daphnia magna]|uniref:Uncharacterized protein n=1 Tax=Daphnia magna TaxID=35525 RepID=A0ABR0A362_9CRUS|nr:hypothetical protein OUZ56_001611 [Daphnia magna]
MVSVINFLDSLRNPVSPLHQSSLGGTIGYKTTPIHSGNFHFRASALLTFDVARHGLILGRIPRLSEVHKIQISVQLALCQTIEG